MYTSTLITQWEVCCHLLYICLAKAWGLCAQLERYTQPLSCYVRTSRRMKASVFKFGEALGTEADMQGCNTTTYRPQHVQISLGRY